MGNNTSQGLPGEFCCCLQLTLWVLFLAVYLGNRKSKINKWFFICGMLFSVGVLKEYLYYSLFPQIAETAPAVMNEETALCIYSVLTAVPYYFATPALFYHRTLFQPHGDTQAKTFSLDKNIRVCARGHHVGGFSDHTDPDIFS